MSLSNIFKVTSILMLINGILGLFVTERFLSMAGFTVEADLITMGQFMGVTFIILSMITWKTVDYAGGNLASFGQIYAIAQLMWVLIIGYHVAMHAAEGSQGHRTLCAHGVDGDGSRPGIPWASQHGPEGSDAPSHNKVQHRCFVNACIHLN